MSNWINCDERMPEEGKLVFGAVYGTDVIIPEEGETVVDAVRRSMYCNPRTKVCQWWGESEGWLCDGYPMIVQPRFWMPMEIPEPPEIETE